MDSNSTSGENEPQQTDFVKEYVYSAYPSSPRKSVGTENGLKSTELLVREAVSEAVLNMEEKFANQVGELANLIDRSNKMVMDNVRQQLDLYSVENGNYQSRLQSRINKAPVQSDLSPLELSEIFARPPVRDNGGRRDTIMERVQVRQPNGGFGNKQVITTAVRFTGKLENVRSPWSLMAFCKDLEQYQAEHPLQASDVNISAYVSEDVIAALRVKYRAFSAADLRNVSKISNERFMAMLHELVKPESTIKFFETLQKTHFREREVSATNFRPFYESYILYERDFNEMYNICARNNDANTPLCSYREREYGLIFVFLNGIKPRDFAWHLFNTHLVQNKYGSEDFQKFLKDFNELMTQFYEKSETAKSLNNSIGYAFKKSSSTTTTATTNVKISGTGRSSFSPASNSFNGRSSNNVRQQTSTNTRSAGGTGVTATRVSHISEQMAENSDKLDDENEEDHVDEIQENNGQLQEAEDQSDVSEFNDGEEDSDDAAKVNVYVPSAGTLMAITPAPTRSFNSQAGTTPAILQRKQTSTMNVANMPCFQLLQHGKCSNSACKYSHDDKIIDEALDTMIRNRRSSKGASTKP